MKGELIRSSVGTRSFWEKIGSIEGVYDKKPQEVTLSVPFLEVFSQNLPQKYFSHPIFGE
jgi:hypothetical protein